MSRHTQYRIDSHLCWIVFSLKSYLDTLANARKDCYFKQTLDIKKMTSSAGLRQRLDEDVHALMPVIDYTKGTLL